MGLPNVRRSIIFVWLTATKHIWLSSRKVAFLPLIHVFLNTPCSWIFHPQVMRSLNTQVYLVTKRHQLICSLLHIGKKCTPNVQINFNIFGKYGDFESWQKAELSSPVEKRKREEKRNGVGLANYISLLKTLWTVTNKLEKDTLCELFCVGK